MVLPAPVSEPTPAKIEWLTPDQVAEWLDVHKATIYKYANRGTIPCVKLGSYLMFTKAAVQAWLDRGGRPSDVPLSPVTGLPIQPPTEASR